MDETNGRLYKSIKLENTMTTTKSKSTKSTKKQQQKEFYLFLDAVIDNAPADLSVNEIWMPSNLYKLLKTKSYRGFKFFTSMFLNNNEVILGKYSGEAQIN